MLRVKRNTGFMGAGSGIKLYLNNEKVGRFRQNKQAELELPSDEASISVSQLGVHSNTLKVKKGQVVEITTQPWTYQSFIVLLIILATIGVFLPSPTSFIIRLLITGVYIASYQWIEGFKLRVIYP